VGKKSLRPWRLERSGRFKKEKMNHQPKERKENYAFPVKGPMNKEP